LKGKNALPRDHLSVSQINLYLACPRKYAFTYVEQLERPFRPSGLAFGSAIHSSLEWLHKELLKGRKPDLTKLLKYFDTDWYVQKLDNVRFGAEGEEAELVRKGQEMLRLYYEVADATSIKSAETPFQVPIVNVSTGEVLDVPLEGVFDLIEQGDSLVEIKTGARQMDILALSQHLQLTAYSHAYRMIYGKEPTLRIVNLIKSKQVRLEELNTERSEEDRIRFFHMAKEVIKGIKAGYFCPHPSWMCAECEYFEPCQTWRG
jgi:putative RecB family exonuclease